MAKKRWLVRISKDGMAVDKAFLDCLRYAGVLGEGDAYWDLFAPASIVTASSQNWAERNADRIRSFGYVAQALPREA